MNNLVGDPAYANLQSRLDALLTKKLNEQGNAFRPGMEYVQQWGYPVNEKQTVPYTK